MNQTILHLISVSAKVALLGGLAGVQLHLLRRSSAAARSRLCLLTLLGVVLLAAGEFWTPHWIPQAGVFVITAATAGKTAISGAPRLASYLVPIWIGVAALLLLRLAAGHLVVWRLRRRSTLLELAEGLEIRAGEVHTPILTGVLHPAILVPPGAAAWTPEERRMVLAHELAHHRDRDAWAMMLARIVRAALWFHPVVWWMTARLSVEQELACDEAVVAAGHSRHDYAAFLLSSARELRSAELLACAMAGSGARSLQQRFATLLDPLPRRASRGRMAAAMASFLLLAVSLTAVRPVWSQSGKTPVYPVGGDVTSPKLLYKTEPQYTPEAKDARIEGRVTLKMVITQEGKADDIEVISGIDPGLDQKALEAVAQWTFAPGTKDGRAVAVRANVEINFRLK